MFHIILSGIMAAAPVQPEYLAYDPILTLFEEVDFEDFQRPGWIIFRQAMVGYNQLKDAQKPSRDEVLTIIDFSKASNEKRLWVIDLKNKKVLFNTLVAHGRNSGDLYATRFSNQPESHQSSLGFYVTGETYFGKHGLSLRLYGAEKGINDNAAARAIVVHGAEYVSETFIKRTGRLGRSYGCPAVPMETHKAIINQVAGGSCFFIYYPDKGYLTTTAFKGPVTQEASIGAAGL